jgi:hypothetical protein
MPTATEGLAVAILLGLFACAWDLRDMCFALTRIGDTLREGQEARQVRCLICRQPCPDKNGAVYCGTCADALSDEKEGK